MSTQEKAQTKPITVGVIAIAVIGFAVALGYHFLARGSAGQAPSLESAFYSDDDGKTYFTDAAYKFPPFSHNGKTAVTAVVFSCSTGNFVGLLQRYTPHTKQALEQAYDKMQNGNLPRTSFLGLLNGRDTKFSGTEVKLPGAADSTWCFLDQAGQLDIKAPDGGSFTQVQP